MNAKHLEIIENAKEELQRINSSATLQEYLNLFPAAKTERQQRSYDKARTRTYKQAQLGCVYLDYLHGNTLNALIKNNLISKDYDDISSYFGYYKINA